MSFGLPPYKQIEEAFSGLAAELKKIADNLFQTAPTTPRPQGSQSLQQTPQNAGWLDTIKTAMCCGRRRPEALEDRLPLKHAQTTIQYLDSAKAHIHFLSMTDGKAADDHMINARQSIILAAFILEYQEDKSNFTNQAVKTLKSIQQQLKDNIPRNPSKEDIKKVDWEEMKAKITDIRTKLEKDSPIFQIQEDLKRP